MAMKKEIKDLPTGMRDQHQYYKICSGASQNNFGVLVLDIIFHKGQEDISWVKFKALFNFSYIRGASSMFKYGI